MKLSTYFSYQYNNIIRVYLDPLRDFLQCFLEFLPHVFAFQEYRHLRGSLFRVELGAKTA